MERLEQHLRQVMTLDNLDLEVDHQYSLIQEVLIYPLVEVEVVIHREYQVQVVQQVPQVKPIKVAVVEVELIRVLDQVVQVVKVL